MTTRHMPTISEQDTEHFEAYSVLSQAEEHVAELTCTPNIATILSFHWQMEPGTPPYSFDVNPKEVLRWRDRCPTCNGKQMD